MHVFGVRVFPGGGGMGGGVERFIRVEFATAKAGVGPGKGAGHGGTGRKLALGKRSAHVG